MKILLVYPETPSTFWSFRNALKFISKKSSEPPLGLLTVAAMLPETWEKELIDMNVSRLKDDHIQWADYVFISGMNVHAGSMRDVIKRCNDLGVKVVAGGPLVTTDFREFEGVDHFILNEAEATLSPFITDLGNGCPKHIYSTEEFPDISSTPTPQWNLLKKKKYASMGVQYSRGCPFNCEFCSITFLNGRRPRTKSPLQFLEELNALYDFGWRGPVFIVDDNFIGNKKTLKSQLLPALIEWSKKKDYPFHFTTEVSINLADDEALIQLMVKAGFRAAFVGVETPNDQSLVECGKTQNQQRDMVAAVKKLHHHGLVVFGGFIVGFDNDPPSIFEQQIRFIQKSGIVTAMVGLLNAPSGSRLFHRLKSENRLLHRMNGDNMDGSINFIPKMNHQKLIAGYQKILRTIYSPKEYYERVKTFLHDYRMPSAKIPKLDIHHIEAFFKSLWILGILEKGKRFFWKLLLFSLFRYPKKIPLAITMAIYGFHFRRVVETI
ncbi:MAG: B12-binding domain-containing radical SAM protein [bacterium]